jgi:hypothetical protein
MATLLVTAGSAIRFAGPKSGWGRAHSNDADVVAILETLNGVAVRIRNRQAHLVSNTVSHTGVVAGARHRGRRRCGNRADHKVVLGSQPRSGPYVVAALACRGRCWRRATARPPSGGRGDPSSGTWLRPSRSRSLAAARQTAPARLIGVRSDLSIAPCLKKSRHAGDQRGHS